MRSFVQEYIGLTSVFLKNPVGRLNTKAPVNNTGCGHFTARRCVKHGLSMHMHSGIDFGTRYNEKLLDMLWAVSRS